MRKGLTDTALKTAESGYLTRRLVDVAQDVTIVEDDCYSDNGFLVEEILDRKSNTVVESLHDRLVGRYIKETIVDPKTKEVIIEEDEYIDEFVMKRIVNSELNKFEFVLYSHVNQNMVSVKNVTDVTWLQVKLLRLEKQSVS